MDDREIKNVKEHPVLPNVREMLKIPEKGKGPDIVIVVSSTDDEASFWQERLAGDYGSYAAGGVLSSSCIICSVSESNWEGPAGNAFGTINAFCRAAEKLSLKGLVNSPGSGIREKFSAMIEFCRGKSVFMYHAAGKGTRSYPVTAAEHGSKSRIKLPGVIRTDPYEGLISVLEAAIRASVIFAGSRKDRLSVFWADQIIIPERSMSLIPESHIELFTQYVELDESIRSYGFVVPLDGGDCVLREKMELEQIKEDFPDISDMVHRSAGSFSLSMDLFEVLGMSEIDSLSGNAGFLNTDTGWWQAITSEIDEFIGFMSRAGEDQKDAGNRWRKLRDLRESFFASKPPEDKRKLISFTDMGEGAIWMDLGRNSTYLENLLRLIGNSSEGRALRVFFDIEKYYCERSVSDGLSLENSIVMDCDLENGKIRDSIVLSSRIDMINSQGSVIVDSRFDKLNSESSLCYGVISEEEKIGPGVVAVDVFDPLNGSRIVVRTDISRDAGEEWKKGTVAGESGFTYPQIADIVTKRNVSSKLTERENWCLRSFDEEGEGDP